MSDGPMTMPSPYCGEISRNAINTLGSECFKGRATSSKSRKAEFIRYVFSKGAAASGGFLGPPELV